LKKINLANLNWYFLQWFFIRVCRWGYISSGPLKQEGWKLMIGVLPLTGWKNPYRGLIHYIKLSGK
jgi:hypothetical protein